MIARLLIRYGNHVPGETIRGTLAEELVAKGMAVDITPERKMVKGAPENKAEEPDETKDPAKPKRAKAKG